MIRVISGRFDATGQTIRQNHSARPVDADRFFDAPEYLSHIRNRTADAKAESLLGLSCLAELLKEYGMAPPVRLARSEAGKPYLPDYPDLHFNLTHTHHTVFCVLSDQGYVGIDAEYLAGREHNEKIAARFFSERERQSDFFTAWTRKEAYLKYLGCGFSVSGGIAAVDTTAVTDVSFDTRDLLGCRVTVCTSAGTEAEWSV